LIEGVWGIELIFFASFVFNWSKPSLSFRLIRFEGMDGGMNVDEYNFKKVCRVVESMEEF